MCSPNINFVSCVHVCFYFSPLLIFTLLAASISHFLTAALNLRILGGRNLVRVRTVVAAIFDFMTVEDWGE